ncbi:MAG: hypothetical protein II655_05140, partial [Thermoguttaceae bacterium]|nr:hypothetical protein [Thermoguttaceae bacterium]
MTQEQKALVINHIATLWTNMQNGDTQAWNDLWHRMIKKATMMSAIGVESRYEDDFDLCKTDERRAEVAATFAEVVLQYFKVRELEKLAKELEAAERERKEAESRAERKAKVAAQNDAEQTVYEQVETEVERREADARIDYAIKQFGRYTQEANAAIRAIEIKKEHKSVGGNSVIGMRLAAAWQASGQQSDRSAFCALLARINAPEWLVDFLASGRCWMISPLTAAHLLFDHCDVEKLEAEQDVYDAVRAYLWSGDDRVLGMVDDDTASELAAMQRSLMRELYLEEAVALVLNALKEKETEDLPPLQDVATVAPRVRECVRRIQARCVGNACGRWEKDPRAMEVIDRVIDSARLEAVKRELPETTGGYSGAAEWLIENMSDAGRAWIEAVVNQVPEDDEEPNDNAADAQRVIDAAHTWTDDDFAIRPEDAYVETMKAIAVEDMEEPEDVELDEYIKEYRAAHKETRARSLARSLRDFLWTRGFTLDDVGKAEWWQTVALRWPSLDEFVAVAKAGGLKNI